MQFQPIISLLSVKKVPQANHRNEYKWEFGWRLPASSQMKELPGFLMKLYLIRLRICCHSDHWNYFLCDRLIKSWDYVLIHSHHCLELKEVKKSTIYWKERLIEQFADLNANWKCGTCSKCRKKMSPKVLKYSTFSFVLR